MPIRVLVADDHRVVRQGLNLLLRLDPDLDVVGEAENGAEAINLARSLHPEVVVMDLLMPVMSGLEAIITIRKEVPGTEILVLTSIMDDRSVVEAIRAGATGYVMKDVNADELRRAIKAAAKGQARLAPDTAAGLIREVRGLEHSEALTERETAVLQLLAAGRANKEIAHNLRIGETTVKSHVRHILAKLGVETRTQAALHAVRSGLIEDESRPQPEPISA